jgi:hypothetical protein
MKLVFHEIVRTSKRNERKKNEIFEGRKKVFFSFHFPPLSVKLYK